MLFPHYEQIAMYRHVAPPSLSFSQLIEHFVAQSVLSNKLFEMADHSELIEIARYFSFHLHLMMLRL